MHRRRCSPVLDSAVLDTAWALVHSLESVLYMILSRLTAVLDTACVYYHVRTISMFLQYNIRI